MATVGPEPALSGGTSDKWASLRLRMLDGVLYTLLLVAGAAVAVAVPQDLRLHNYMRAFVYATLYLPIIPAALFKSLGYTVRAAVFPVAQLLLGLFFVYCFGIGSYALMLLFGAVVFTGVFFGLRAGLVMFAVALAGVVLLGWWTFSNFAGTQVVLQEFTTNIWAWIIVVLVFSFLALTSLVTHSVVLNGLAASLRESQTLVQSLEHEIEARRQAEEKAVASRKLLSDVLEAASEVAIVATDAEGLITLFNRGAERMLGYTADEMTGRMTPLSFHFEPEVTQRAALLTSEMGRPIQGFEALVCKPAAEGSENREWTLVRKNGSHLPVSLAITPMRGDDGQIRGYLWVAADISARITMETALRESEDRFRNIIEQSPISTMMLDPEGNTVHINEACASLWGVTEEQTRSYNIFQDRQLEALGFMPLVRRAFAGERITTPEVDYNLRSALGAGERAFVQGHFYPIHDDEGKMVCVILVHQDFTERRRAERHTLEASARIARQQNVIGSIATSPQVARGEVDGAAREITESAGAAMNIERVSVWLFDGSETRLECIDLCERTPGKHSRGAVLCEEDFRDEFRTLKGAKYVDADDPFTDPRTAGYVESYLKPLHITSMLDTVIRAGGRNLGLLCFEHVNQAHHWESDEIAFGCQLADQLALTIANRERHRAEAELRESEERYSTIFNTVHDALFIHDTEGRIVEVNQTMLNLFGVTREEARSMRIVPDFSGPENPVDQLPSIWWRVTNGETIFLEWNARRPHDGVCFPVDVWLQRADFGGAPLILANVRDVSEIMQAREELKWSRDQFQSLVSSIPGATYRCLFDEDWTMLFISSEIERLSGYSPGDFIDNQVRSYTSIIHRDDTGLVASRIREAVEAGRAWEIEYRICHKDGSVRWAYEKGRAIPGKDGQPEYLDGFILDITERKRLEEEHAAAEQALRESEEHFRILFQQSPAPMLVYERDTLRLLAVNEAFGRRYGYSHEEALELRLTDLYPDGEREQIRELAARLRGHAVTGEWHHVRRDGSVIDVVAPSQDIRFEGREGRVLVITDITDIKRAQEEVLGEKQFSESVLNSLPGIFFLYDQDFNLRRWNKNHEVLLGYSAEELPHLRPPQDYFAEQDYGKVMRAFQTVLETGEGILEASIRDKKGTYIPYRLTGAALDTPEGRMVAGIGLDIAESVKAEEALRYHSAFQHLVADVSSRFVAADAHSLDEIIHGTLRDLAVFVGADAGYVYSFSEDGACVSMIHEWHAEGFPLDRQRLQNLPVSEMPWRVERLRKGEVTAITSIADLPPEAGREKDALASRGVRALVDVPLLIQGRAEGFLGFDSLRENRRWTEGEIALLQFTGEVLSSALRRIRAEEALRRARDGLEIEVQERTAELKASEDRFRTLFSASRDAIMVLDESAFLDCNAATLDLYGCRQREEFIGKHPSDFSPAVQPCGGDSRALAARHIVKAFREGHEFFEWIHTRANGEEFPCEVVLSSMVLDGRPVLQAIVRDITQRKQGEKALQLAKTRLEAANKELEAFSYSVSHDLRAPLRAIDGFSQALFEDYGDRFDAEGLDYLARVRKGAQRMGALIDDMLTLSRVTRGELRFEPVDLSAMAAQVLDELRAEDPERQVAASVQPGVTAQGDPRMLLAVMNNLIGNAWKFTSKRNGARIAFGMEQRGGETVYYVQDNGAGFDMAYSEKLFGAFQRLHSPEEFPGTGVGLATVQRIIHRHGGRVWAEGKVGHGATFCFVLAPQA